MWLLFRLFYLLRVTRRLARLLTRLQCTMSADDIEGLDWGDLDMGEVPIRYTGDGQDHDALAPSALVWTIIAEVRQAVVALLSIVHMQ